MGTQSLPSEEEELGAMGWSRRPGTSRCDSEQVEQYEQSQLLMHDQAENSECSFARSARTSARGERTLSSERLYGYLY
jgi:hypothetical protein